MGFFEQVGRTVRDSRGFESARGSGTHDSGYGERPGTNAGAAAAVGTIQDQFRISKMTPRGTQPVYGVVAYDFKAERPDELEAKEGEAIIVIAQSNPEWFVAKPITRLGGPGLIPVAFVEIKDMQTGQTISDTTSIVAMIPKVEEWKKMAAEYKNTSIPLGTIGTMDNAQAALDRMSLQSNGHSRSQSSFSRVQSHHYLAPLYASVPRYIYADDKFHFVIEVTLSDNTHWDLTRIYEDFYELQINLIKAFPEEAGNMGRGRTLPLMPGPVQFVTDRITEGRRENLDEYLYKLLNLGSHIRTSTLVRGFFAPRGNDYECDGAQILDEHARSAYAPGGTRYTDRYSGGSHVSVPIDPHGSALPASSLRRGSGSTQSYHPTNQAHQRGQSVVSQQSRAPTAQSHYRIPSDATFATSTTTAPSMTRTQTSTTTVSTAPSISSTIGPSGGALKVKVWYDRDTCVVLRLPPRGTFSYTELHRKIMERRRLEFQNRSGEDQPQNEEEVDTEEAGLCIEYRDEGNGEYLVLDCDEALSEAEARCDKLTLVVRSAS